MAAGMSEELAAAQAEVMAEAFVMNVDNLITRDYLQVCLKSLEDRLVARLDGHDRRFEAIDARFDRIDARFDQMEAQIAAITSNFRLMFWLLAAIAATTVVPALQQLFAGTLFG